MFYGWIVVAAIWVSQFFVVGFYTYGYPLIVEPVQRDFDASVTEVQFGFVIGAVIGIGFPPLIGPWVDRWSARGFMLIGAAALIAGLLAMASSPTVLIFAISFGVIINVANTLLGPLTSSTLVSRWFEASRGRALGIMATGTSVGALLVPWVLGERILAVGWRSSLRELALAVAIVCLPLLFLGLRDHPSDKGLHPDGADAPTRPPEDASQPLHDRARSTGEILRIPGFWLIGSTLGLLFMAYTGVLTNLPKFVTSLGVEADRAPILMQTIGLMGLIGKLLFGWAADRIGLKWGLWIALGLAGLGIGLLSTEPAFEVIWLATVLMGLAAGGMLPVWGGLIAAAFGLASYGRAMGLMLPLISVFTAPGPILAARSMDLTGSYATALQGFVLAIAMAIGLLVLVRLPTAPAARASA